MAREAVRDGGPSAALGWTAPCRMPRSLGGLPLSQTGSRCTSSTAQDGQGWPGWISIRTPFIHDAAGPSWVSHGDVRATTLDITVCRSGSGMSRKPPQSPHSRKDYSATSRSRQGHESIVTAPRALRSHDNILAAAV